MKTGKIVLGIDKNLYFEYYELGKPPPSYESGCHLGYRELKLKEYEASKRLIKVSNKNYQIANTSNQYWILINREHKMVKNNQKCKAKITGDTCTIVELL